MKKILLLVLCAVMIVTMAACGDAHTETPETTVAPTEATAASTEAPTEAPTEPEPTAEEIYAQAVEELSGKTSLKMEINSGTKTVVGDQTFVENHVQTMKLQNIGAENLALTLSDSVMMGSYRAKNTETLMDGMLYYTLAPTNGTKTSYATEMTGADYLEDAIPVVLLDASLYESVSFVSDNQIEFSGATALEGWIGSEDAQLIEASGTVELDDEKSIVSSTYTVTYRLGTTMITRNVTTKISDDAGEAITVPAGAENYRKLEGNAAYAPYLIQSAIGYIGQMSMVNSVEEESAVAMATGWSYYQQGKTDVYVAGEKKLAKMEYIYQLADLYSGEYYFDDLITETFDNGAYTYQYNGQEPEKQAVNYNDLMSSLTAANLKTIPGDAYVDSYEVDVYGGTILMEYHLNDKADTKLSTGVAGLMFAEADTLDRLASAYRTDEATGYIGIDMATGVPVAIGLDYTGVHTIEGEEYELIYSSTRTFQVGRDSVYETITGDKLLKEETKEGATPLFYKVTGADGQQMWLLGTIHVGDGRTANLPDEVWKAFDESDALALEFNSTAFTERTETDAAFANQLMELYFYPDGTRTEEHISDPEVYEYALKQLKAVGLANGYTEQLKAATWYQDLSNYNDCWNYSLSGDEGMDSRLEERAREQGKEIREVESGLAQMQMIYGFSDGIQEMLLKGILSFTPVENVDGVNELYELWCSGDEETLIDYLYGEEETDEEMTEEEELLYEEYVKAMETDRNAAMLEVAKGYLESGDVVFYAVGLAHMIAEDGLVNTLREAGYTVEVVPYS